MKKILPVFITICFLFSSFGVEVDAASSYIKTLNVSASYTSASLSWTKLTAKQQKKVSGIAVFRNGVAVKNVSKKTSSYSDSGLKEGTTYKYQIKCYKTSKQKQWYNKKTGKWQTKKPAKKYRGKSRKITIYKYSNASPVRTVTTKKHVEPVETGGNTGTDSGNTGVDPGNNSGSGSGNTTYTVDLYSCTAGGGSMPYVDLFWKVSANSSSMTFAVYRDDVKIAEMGYSVKSYTDNNVANDTTYTYKVVATVNGQTYSSAAKTVTTPSNPNEVTSADGSFTDVSVMYDYINEFRQDPVNQWYRNQSNEIVSVNASDLVTLERDAQLEAIAKQRAKEQWIVYYEQNKQTPHTRPDGQSCEVTVYEMGMTPIAECHSTGSGSLNRRAIIFGDGAGIIGWSEPNEQYYYQGHRRIMLLTDPHVKKVGFGGFKAGNNEVVVMVLAY